MATKPELSTNNQGIQNVLVYVSNDNFAQAYAVNQQNVPTSQVIPNGAYHPSSHTMAPLAQKCFPDKVKQPTADYPSYYPVISHNGFPVNYQINQIKNAGPPTGAPSTDKVRDECEYLDSNCVIVGPDGQVRCDSVRSDAAESSCSSLSSADEVNQSQEMVVFDGSGVSVRHGGVVLTVGPNVGPQSAHLGGNNQLSVAVPYGWKRILNNGAIVYISPSNAALGSMEQLREYLLSPGTCKCGLECPLKFEATFSFDPKVVGKPWVLTPDTNTGDLTKLCNHKRKILSMASLGCKPPDPSKIPKDFNIAKRKKRKVAGPYSGVSVSQILAQRDGNSNNKYQKELIGTDQQQVAWAQNRLQGYQPDQQNGQHYLRYQDGQPINRVDGSPIVIDSGIVQQQQNISNPNIQHQQIVSPNGQIISIPSGQVLTQNNLLVQQGSPGHQRIFINGQPTEPTGPGRPGIQMIPVSRQERQQFYAQTPHYGMRPSFVQNNYPPHQIQQLPIQQQQHQQQQQQQQHHQQQQQQHHHQQQQQKLWSKNQSPSPQNIDQRVPPLHQHQPQPNVWHDEVNRKKVKSSKVMKKRPYIIDQQNGRIIEAPCPNIDVRQIPSEGGRVMHFQQNQGTSSPSFLEDPSGYLAQQTALLNTINNTINRQTGANNVTFSCNSPNQAHQAQQPQPIHQQSLPQQNGVPLPSNLAKSSNMTIRPNNVIHVMKQGVQPYQQLVLPPQEVDSSQQECDGSAYQEKVFQRRPDSQPSTPGSLGEDPVTSSTYDKNTSPDSRPIQGGAISTSNHSPQDGSPGPSRDGHFVFRDKEGYFDVQKISGGLVTTMASGRTVGSNTITSVLAGKANTATVSINTAPVTPANNNQVPQITLNVSKTPLEMVQSVVSNIQVPSSQIQGQMSPQIAKSHSFPSGSILVSSGGQLIVANTSNQGSIMAPPPPKLVPNNSMPPISVSPMITNVTAAVSQVIPAVAAQQVLGQQTVLVNALPGPFVLQPGVTMTMDGMTVAPQLLAGNVIHHQQQIQIDNSDPRRGAPVLLSPETKRKGKKRKMPSQTVASMLQNANIVMSPQGFPQQIQMAHSPQNVGAAPVMQALTIVPGKAGQLVMNNQQLIANSQPTQQINLLQPVNLLNGGMVQNFPTIQQFIVPNLGSMVMNPDGTATLLQDNIGMQLQLQNVNGQNVLTPVQNNNVFNGGQNILPAGMVIRTPSGSQGKIIQQQHSPGAQFLSPNGSQFLVNGQLSPLIANVSPSQQVTFNTTPQAIRTANQPTQQEFMMVPVSSSNQNTTFVQQNTTIVQQQTTMVSNNQNFQNNQNQQERPGPPTHQNFLITGDKQQPVQALVFQSSSRQSPQNSLNYRQSVSTQTLVNRNSSSTFCQTSTSTVSSPPDTTTHSPLASGGQSPPTADTTTHTGSTDDGLSPAPSNSSCGDAVTVHNRQQNCSMAMVHCVSSSEPDSVEMGGQNPDLQDWNQRPQQPLHSTPKMEFTDISSLGQGMTQVAKKTNSNPIHMAYAESSTLVSGMHVMSDQMKHDVMNSRAFEKYMQRKRLGETLVVVEGRHELFDGENEVAKTVTEPKNRFIIGDLVWGPAKGCQAWPGKIEQFTNGKVTVRWFGGDKTTTDVDPGCLQTLTEGLDAHHGARKKSRTSRKLNTLLENAIQEAMKELDKKSENPEKKTPGRLRSKIKTEQNNR